MTNLNKIVILSLVVGLILTPSLIGLVKANSSPVSVAITASPSTICVGQSSHLTWSSLNATNVSIDQGIGSVPLNGDRHVSPSRTATYTVTGSNSGDSGTTSVTVFVNNCSTPTPTPTPTPSHTPTPTPSLTPTPTPTPATGTIKLIKEVINNNGGTARPTDFDLYVGGIKVQHNVAHTFAAGNYNIFELQHSNYHLAGIRGDCQSNFTLRLNPGQNAVCIITNDDFGFSTPTPTPTFTPTPTPTFTPTPTPTITFTPTPTPSVVNLSVEPPSCANGSYSLPLIWSGTGNSGFGFYVDISTNSNFSNFWNKQVF